MMKNILISIAMFVVSFSSFSADGLILQDAWVREAPPMAKNLAGYAEVKNISNHRLKIVSISSPMFVRVEMHITSFDQGMMRMKQVKTLMLTPGESVIFEPSGRHFMLIKPKQRITKGLIVPIEITLDTGRQFVFDMKVRK